MINGKDRPGGIINKLEFRNTSDTHLPAFAERYRLDAVRPLGYGIGIYDFQTRDYTHIQAVDRLCKIPFRTKIAERHVVTYRSQRGPPRRTRADYGIQQDPGADIVVHHGETVAPTLKRIVDIPVDYHILRQIVQVQPLV